MSMKIGNSDYAYAAYSIPKTGKNSQVGKTDVSIAPEMLNKMAEDSKLAAKYEKMISKIPALDRWADSMIRSMTGSEVKYRQVWIDKDGNMGSMCITGPGEEQAKDKQYRTADLLMKSVNEDRLSLSQAGQESYRQLSSVCEQDYVNRFEAELSKTFDEDDHTDAVSADSFEHHVNKMAAAYDKMKNSIEEKYSRKDRKPEYYIAESGKIEELTKEKEMDMLDRAYKSHSTFMAASTEIWEELQDFTPTVVSGRGSEPGTDQPSGNEEPKKTAKKGSIRNVAYQAFLSAIRPDNQRALWQHSGNRKELRLNLDVSASDRERLNRIWDYYVNNNKV